MIHNFLKKREDIVNWLHKNDVINFSLIPDKKYGYIVNVEDQVIIYKKDLDFIPVKFNKVNGTFNCEKNNLKSLKGCPIYVGGGFYCSDNKLTSLEFCPEIIKGNFICYENNLTNLHYFPNHVGGEVDFSYNKKLSKLQKENDFKTLYQAHVDYLKQLEYKNLNDIMDNTANKIIKKNKI